MECNPCTAAGRAVINNGFVMPVSMDGYKYQDVARAVEIGIHDRYLEQGQHSLQGGL